MSAGGPPAILLGGSYNSLSAARSLGRAGIEVHALGDGLGAPLAGRSRYASRSVEFSGDGVQDAWFDWLTTFGLRPAVVLPCCDDALELLANRRNELAAFGCVAPDAADDVVLAMLDKARTYELAAAAGISVPETIVARSGDDLDRAGEKLGFPCALKPLHSHQWARTGQAGKAVVVDDPGSLRTRGRELLDTGLDMLVTEIVPGSDDRFCSYYSWVEPDGAPAFHFTKRKLRQYPIGFGSGTFHESAWDPEVAREGLRFFRAVGLRGLGNVEFKRDGRDGRLRLIECNPRLTAANDLLERAGLDLARYLYARALGGVPPVGPEFDDGVRQWLPGRDLRALAAYRRAGELSVRGWVRSVLRPPLPRPPAFSIADPRPSLGRLGALASKVARRQVHAVARTA